MSKMTDRASKDGLFNILNLEPKAIMKLGDLARHEDVETLAEMALIDAERRKEEETEFEFKKKLGNRVEEILRSALSGTIESPEIEVLDVQVGQDIEIRIKGVPVYYIEVKSRWKTGTSITMSPTQFQKAAQNPGNYALCAVNMINYKSGDAGVFI